MMNDETNLAGCRSAAVPAAATWHGQRLENALRLKRLQLLRPRTGTLHATLPSERSRLELGNVISEIMEEASVGREASGMRTVHRRFCARQDGWWFVRLRPAESAAQAGAVQTLRVSRGGNGETTKEE